MCVVRYIELEVLLVTMQRRRDVASMAETWTGGGMQIESRSRLPSGIGPVAGPGSCHYYPDLQSSAGTSGTSHANPRMGRFSHSLGSAVVLNITSYSPVCLVLCPTVAEVASRFAKHGRLQLVTSRVG